MEDILIGLGVPIIAVGLLTFIINTYCKDALALLYRKAFAKYIWEPNPPLLNKNEVKHISKYPRDIKISVINNILQTDFGATVEGAEGILQHLRTFILTERYKYKIYSENYGIEEAITIFKAKPLNEFYRQCSSIAQHILEFYSEWIIGIYKISRKNNELIIEFKVKGEPELLCCIVPNLHKEVEQNETTI